MELIVTLPAIILIVVGIIVCFSGYRFFRLSLALIGAGIGFSLGNYIFDKFIDATNLGSSDIFYLVVVLFFTIGLASLSYVFYLRALMVVTTIGTGYWISSFCRTYWGKDDIKTFVISWLIGIGIGIIIGLVIRSLNRWAIILFTSIGGARIVAGLSAPFMITNEPLKNTVIKIANSIFPGLIGKPVVLLSGMLTLILFTAGVIVQSKGKH